MTDKSKPRQLISPDKSEVKIYRCVYLDPGISSSKIHFAQSRCHSHVRLGGGAAVLFDKRGINCRKGAQRVPVCVSLPPTLPRFLPRFRFLICLEPLIFNSLVLAPLRGDPRSRVSDDFCPFFGCFTLIKLTSNNKYSLI